MLTRNQLKSLGIEGDKIDAIVEMHSETVEGLKGVNNDLKAQLENLKGADEDRTRLQAELDKATKTINSYKEKMQGNENIVTERDQLKTEVDSLKAKITEFTEKENTANTELTSLREQLATLETDKSTATAEAERLKGEFDAFKTQIETEKTNAAKRDAVRTALRNGGVTRSDFQDLILNSMSMDDVTVGENGIEDADSFIQNTKAKYPSCFGTVTEGGTPPVNPMGGNQNVLTIEQIKHMTADEINNNWEAVQKVLSSQK